MNFKLIDLINSISCFQLAIFSFFLIHKGRKQISNIILSIFFLVQLIVIFNFFLVSTIDHQTNFYLQIVYFHFPFKFLWGPLMYFYVKSQINPRFQVRRLDLVHLIPFVLAALFIISSYSILDTVAKRQFIESRAIFHWFLFSNFTYYLLLFGYNLFALLLIVNYQKNLKNYCTFEVKRNLVWLKFVLYGYFITCLITAVPNFAGEYFPISYNDRMLAQFIPFLILFNILFYKAMINPYVIFIPDEKPKYSSSNLYDSDIQDYGERIESFLIHQKSFLNPSLTLHDFSEAIGISERTISQVINQKWNQNFFSFINSFRIEEAKSLLKDFDQNKSTMLGISFDAGFNSKSAFYDAFKKCTGTTPTEYRKENSLS